MKHRQRMRLVLASAGVGVAAFTATALAQEPADRAEQRTESSADAPTAEELLKSLRAHRAGRDVLSPTSGPWSGARHGKRTLWPEGWAVVDIGGYLRRDGSWWTFAPDAPEELDPIRLLPNATLEVMVRTATNASGPVRFNVSGQTTVYEDRNYLLLHSLARDRNTPPPNQSDDTEPVATDGSVEDVMGVLQEQGDDDLLDTRPEEEASARGASLRPLLPDGAAIISRPARVVRIGKRYDLVFESDHPDNPEPPLTLLPNLNMERMLEAVRGDNHGQVFRVSGDVTQFLGRNYILVRSAPQRVDTDNFRK